MANEPASHTGLELTAVERDRLLGRITRFGSTTRRRGEQYYHGGRVIGLAATADGITAVVRGGATYEVHWVRTKTSWRSGCTCPVEIDCKHAYAAALALIARPLAAPVTETMTESPPAPPRSGRSRRKAVARVAAAPPDLAARFAAAREPWRRRYLLAEVLRQARVYSLTLPASVLALLDEPDAELLCWRLARWITAQDDARLPPALEPYHDRPDLAARHTAAESRALITDLLSWVDHTQRRAARSLRFVWHLLPGSWPQLGVTAHITTARLADAPRTTDQLRQLYNELLHTPGILPPEQRHLLGVFFDGVGYGSGHPIAPHAVLAMLRAANDTDGLMTWAAELPADLAARAGVAPGAPLRLASGSVSLQPAARAQRDGAQLTLACVWPDGTEREAAEFLYFPGLAHHRHGLVLADGTFFPVHDEPRPDLRDRFLRLGAVHVPAAQCGAVLAPLAERFATIRATLAAHTRVIGGTPIVTLDLRDDDWLHMRVLLYDGPEPWQPGDPLPDGARVLEHDPAHRWVHWSRDHRATDDEERVAAIDGDEPGAAQASPASAAPGLHPDAVWLEAPDPDRVAPLQQWLQATGATARGATSPDASDAPTGWWVQATPRRLATFGEAWDARPRDVRFLGTARIRRLLGSGQVVRPTIRVTASGLDWFAVSAEWQAEGLTLSDADFARLRTATGRFVRLSGGWVRRDAVDAHDASAAVLADLGVEVGGGEQRVTLWQLAGASAASLAAFEQMAGGRAAQRALAALRTRVRTFTGVPELPVPAGVRADLRPYQLYGFRFLAYTAQLGIGAVLADDMGLGKTLQALTWLQHLVEKDPDGGPALVVCPTSVMHNWVREAAQFTPGLRVLLLERGARRHALRRELATHDLVVTNYALLRRDLAAWETTTLRAVIFDEAQHIKNPDAAVTQAAGALQARHRLALTGTPLENRPLDLWSIVSVVNPGYLGTRADFSARFDRLDAPPHARTLLAARLRPILLRRLKREVAADLPDRIEERRDCELSDGQRQLYLAELRRSRELVAALGDDPAAVRRNRISILAALTRLRQICCHPALAGGAVRLGSGKFEALFELLEPLLAEGHKVLLFSQFVQCLRLLERELRRRDIAHHVLTGQTTRRAAVVEAFQTDPRPGVFLISLKAGGTGLNLTAASYVVLFDPWWNPAVEAQAIDRTHRIGQDRTVIAYRLIARGTIEEKIWELQQQKAALVRDILGEAGFARALSRADLDYLLADTAPDAAAHRIP